MVYQRVRVCVCVFVYVCVCVCHWPTNSNVEWFDSKGLWGLWNTPQVSKQAATNWNCSPSARFKKMSFKKACVSAEGQYCVCVCVCVDILPLSLRPTSRTQFVSQERRCPLARRPDRCFFCSVFDPWPLCLSGTGSLLYLCRGVINTLVLYCGWKKVLVRRFNSGSGEFYYNVKGVVHGEELSTLTYIVLLVTWHLLYS